MLRQLSRKQKIITEYFVEEPANSREEESRINDLSKDKQDTISRTKIIEFDPQHESEDEEKVEEDKKRGEKGEENSSDEKER